MAVEAIKVIEPVANIAPPSPLRSFWFAFQENKGAVFGLGVLAVVAVLAILAGLVAPYSPLEQFRGDGRNLLLPPVWQEGGTWKFVLGTDGASRDTLSRLIHGARLSLFIGLAVMCVSIVAGIVLGLVAAFGEQIVAALRARPIMAALSAAGLVLAMAVVCLIWLDIAFAVFVIGVLLALVALLAAFFPWFIDFVIMRIMDLIMAVPGLVLAIIIVPILGPSLTNTIVAVTIVFLPRYVRLVRASAIGELSKEYVTAAKVSGVRLPRLMFVTVLPNCLAPLTVQAALGVSEAILEAAALGFLGLGAQPPAPEWGAMLADNREFIRSNPWVMAWPGLAILVTVVSINLVGDGLRDALDPKLQRS